MLTPIIPFEPVSSDIIPSEENWVSQIKWDGVRVLTYYDGKDLKLYNRKINERTYHYPELTKIKSYCRANSVILDGEIIALGSNGKPSFHRIMRRDAIKRIERVKEVQRQVKITYMVFDVLYYNGHWINEQSLEKRMEILSDIIIPGEHIQLVATHHDGKALYEVIKHHEMEGIVIKDLNSRYFINGKNDRWQKKKYYRDLVGVVGGATLRDGVINALLLGLFDQKGQLWYIGHVGTGKLRHSDWQDLTQKVKPLTINESPFINKSERIKDCLWLKPEITVKIKFIEWTEGRMLRQPSILAFVEMLPKECILENE